MPTKRPRIQVTIDDELAEAIALVGDGGGSRSTVIRDLAVRGARALADERAAVASATDLLRSIADGSNDGYDFDVLADVYAEREARLL